MTASEPGTRRAHLLIVAAVAPLLVAFAGSVWVVVGWAAGGSPFWPDPPVTLSEAAATRNAGEVVRLITIERRDPNRAWPVREGMLGLPQAVTPLEAAVMIRRAELVPVLVRYGAIVPNSGSERTALICRAVAAGAGDIVEMLLEMGDGTDPRGACPEPAP